MARDWDSTIVLATDTMVWSTALFSMYVERLPLKSASSLTSDESILNVAGDDD